MKWVLEAKIKEQGAKAVLDQQLILSNKKGIANPSRDVIGNISPIFPPQPKPETQ